MERNAADNLRRKVRDVASRCVRETFLATMRKPLPERIGLCLHDVPASLQKEFVCCIQFFLENGYRFCDPDGYAHGEGKRLLLSFDDNFISWMDIRDILREFEVTATFFINTMAIQGRDSKPAIEKYYRNLGRSGARSAGIPLSESDIRTLHADGHTIGCHSHSHIDLSSMAAEEAIRDIEINRQILESIIGEPVRSFAPPYGRYRGAKRTLTREQYAWASTQFGSICWARSGHLFAKPDPHNLHRTVWQLDRTLPWNVNSLCIDGELFTRITGLGAAS